MKKTIAIILAFIMLNMLAACGRVPEKTSEPVVESATEAATTEEQTTAAQTTADESTFSPDYPMLNSEALERIEDADNFAVTISSAELVPGFFLNPDNPPMARTFVGDDGLTLSIKNNTNQTVTEINTYVIGYGADGAARVLPTEMMTTSAGDKDVYIQHVDVSGTVQPGETGEWTRETYIGDIQGVKCIVASYIADGKEVKNLNADEWLKNVYQNKSNR